MVRGRAGERLLLRETLMQEETQMGTEPWREGSSKVIQTCEHVLQALGFCGRGESNFRGMHEMENQMVREVKRVGV